MGLAFRRAPVMAAFILIPPRSAGARLLILAKRSLCTAFYRGRANISFRPLGKRAITTDKIACVRASLMGGLMRCLYYSREVQRPFLIAWAANIGPLEIFILGTQF